MKLRLISTAILILGLLAAPAFMGASTALAAEDTYNASYEAQFEIYPDDICWRGASEYGYPSFDNGVLVIDTGTNGYNIEYYIIDDKDKLVPPTYKPNKKNKKPWLFEVTAKYGPGTVPGPDRSHMMLGFSPFDYWSGNLGIGDDVVFLLSNYGTRGMEASVDTNDAFHTYRIEVVYDDIIENAWVANVYYDNGTDPILTEKLWYFASNHKRIWFGDGTRGSSGISYWKSVKFNAYNGICGIFLP